MAAKKSSSKTTSRGKSKAKTAMNQYKHGEHLTTLRMHAGPAKATLRAFALTETTLNSAKLHLAKG